MSLDLDFNVYEDLNKTDNRYEYIAPNYDFKNKLLFSEKYGNFDFKSSGYYKNYNSNVKETFLINDFLWKSNNHISYIELVSLGSLSASIVKPLEVFHLAVQKKSPKIVLVHNHPSGDLTPSEPDKVLTENLVKMLSPILDELTNCSLLELFTPSPTTAVLSVSSDGAFVVIKIAPEVAFLP